MPISSTNGEVTWMAWALGVAGTIILFLASFAIKDLRERLKSVEELCNQVDRVDQRVNDLLRRIERLENRVYD